MTRDYDGLAEIYDLWADADPAAAPSLSFYLNRMRQDARERVELGVGTGRIAIPVLRQGGSLTGVDSSPRMLEICQAKANRTGVASSLRLLRQDVRRLDLATPAELVIFPFRSIGHLLTEADKLACLRSVYANLVPGGRFVFDHYVWNEAWARAHDGVATLMVDRELGGRRVRVYDLYRYRYDERRMDCSVCIQSVIGDAGPVDERVQRFEFSWIDVDEVRRWADQTGFEVESVYGSFDLGQAFGPNATDQVWTLRRPVTS